MDTLEPTSTLPWLDLRMPGVPVAGSRRPNVYAGGGSTGDNKDQAKGLPMILPLLVMVKHTGRTLLQETLWLAPY